MEHKTTVQEVNIKIQSIKDELSKLKSLVFVRFDFQGDWVALRDAKGESITCLIEAKTFLRSNTPDRYWQISQFDQAMMDNGQISNC
jgi:hypothetical protein